ncbi:MAG: hypothetical protein Tsb0014_26200 [Pleurocapsa sp.]
MIREALTMLLEKETDFQIVGTADNGLSAIEQVEKLNPDLVLMNIEMPGLDGTTATQTITKQFPDTKVLILSSSDNEEYITKTLAVGAKGYLLKDSNAGDIATAIRSVDKGYTQIAPGLLEKLLVQTDCGVILNKLQGISHVNNPSSSLIKEKPKVLSSNNTVLELQSIASQHNTKLEKLNHKLHKVEQELPNVKKIVSSYSKHIWRIWILLLTSMPVIFLILFSLYTRTNNLEKRSVPIERVGLYGELHLSGLAQRVVTALRQDTELANIPNIYVAQKGDVIFLKGTVSNSTIFNRMENVAKNVEGVAKVDTSSLEIK